MGILDEAIREHLELKRQHGAAESELKQLEDEAFGPPGRPGDEDVPPDALSEAPTEFMVQPQVGEPEQPAAEGPKAGGEEEPEASAAPTRNRREPAPELADLQEAPETPEPEEPSDEEAPAMEHEAIHPGAIDAEQGRPEPVAEEPSPAPSTEERHAIADQPTELYDVAGEEFGGSEETAAPTEDGGEDDDFFDEKRLSDELDEALEAPEDAEPEGGDSLREGEEPEEETGEEPSSARHEEDLLEETPDFLEEAPEDDRLWFEQKPPKDFDFDD